jgi:hypothetical protein
MSVQAMSWVIEHSKHKGNAFVVLLMIANHARADGTGAWPSVKTLAKEARISSRSVQNTLRRLERSGELQTSIAEGPKGSNLYSLPRYAEFAPPPPAEFAPPTQHNFTPPTQIRATSPAAAMSPEPSLKQPLDNRPKSFVPPTLEELTSYCDARQSKIDTIKFWNHYEANGWMAGRVKMRNWKAAVGKWERNEIGGNGNGTRYESKGELLERKNKETAERCRRELADGDGEDISEGHLPF